MFNNSIFHLPLQDRHCVLLTNDLKKLQEEHHRVITENNNLIGKLTTDLNELQKNKLSNPQNYDDILNLKSQLKECFKQNQQLNNTLQNLTVSINYFYINTFLICSFYFSRLKMINYVQI